VASVARKWRRSLGIGVLIEFGEDTAMLFLP